ncbi:ABC transporter ATP-binding protein [Herbaspirillum sp. AP02]|uniref:ABC transporter ATP-binding protein n=1 Tax=unclassified Herbaspirillum TaxID=2624150 RepID=UPI0015DA69F4|nr:MULTISPECIES: ABC transporter ATP-binding protein [unclassified Herbaspirillum]MBG7619998.1 ABC transporter ATP-binding protein [Herbaspirillum sp. AP02]NZD69250.1 ABC transporter ATP-binding protein [Herbaspirillum sp. AP21]
MSALLQTRGLQLAFGGVVVADSIDFELQAGERLAVIGQNGAGKTTFINICTGFIRPTGGSVHFDGGDITRMTPRAIVQRGIGRSFQLPQLFLEHSVRDCIRLAAAGRNGVLRLWTPLARVLPESEIDRILELVGLRQRADDPCSLLPEGQRKLLDIAMALVLQPKLLIMDEPTSGVSTEEKHGLMAIIMRVLDEQKITSIFVEHDVDIVTRYATRVAAWISGRIAADGKPQEVLGNPDIRRNVIGE